MSFLIMIIIPLVFSFLLQTIDAQAAGVISTINAFVVVCYIVSGIMSLIAVGCHAGDYKEQIKDIEYIKKYGEDKIVYQKKADYLLQEFQIHLIDKYPQLEEKLIKEVVSNNVILIMSEFPDLKSSNTISAYCKEMNLLMSTVYQQDLNISSAKARMRMRRRSIWIFKSIIPTE